MATQTLSSALASAATLAVILSTACSSAPTVASVSTSEAVTPETAGTAGAPCDPSNTAIEPCAPHFYCEPKSTTSCGSKGTCTASPEFCFMIDAPVCGCDGQRYYNSCWATIGNPNEPGSTTAFTLAVPPTIALLTGTWSRSAITGTQLLTESLVLNADMTYSLTEETRCAPAPGRICNDLIRVSDSAGTYALGDLGPILTATSSQNPGNLATEFALQHACPGQGLVLQGNEPQGTGPAIYLAKQ